MGEPRELAVDPIDVPASLAAMLAGRRWMRDTVGEAGAAVYRLHAAGEVDLFLKHGEGAPADDVVDEMVRLRWLAAYLAVPPLRGFVLDDTGAWLLTEAVPGRTAWQMLDEAPAERPRIVAALANHLRALHAIPVEQCPFDASLPVRMALAWRRVEAGEVDTEDFGDEHDGWTALEVWREMQALLPIAPDPVVTHGDYSLDNVLMEDGMVTGVIDLGRLGTADRYQDLAILANCLDEFEGDLATLFFQAYSIAVPDARKLRLHRCLDEMF